MWNNSMADDLASNASRIIRRTSTTVCVRPPWPTRNSRSGFRLRFRSNIQNSSWSRSASMGRIYSYAAEELDIAASDIFTASAEARAPSSRAAISVSAFAGPMPLWRAINSAASIEAIFDRCPLYWLRICSHRVTTLTPLMPVLKIRAISSASSRLLMPRRSAFSRGRSPSSISDMRRRLPKRLSLSAGSIWLFPFANC